MSDIYEEHAAVILPKTDDLADQLNRPSAPPADENNGFEQIEHNEIENAVETVVNALAKETKTDEVEVNKILSDFSSQVTSAVEEPKLSSAKAEALKEETATTACTKCPYSLKGVCSKFSVSPKVRDLMLWKCPKLSGVVFGTLLVLLISLANFSLLTVVSTLLLLALSSAGAYRFYLSVLFRIKGTYDDTFDKLSAYDMSLPKDKIQEIARQVDANLNQSLNKLKSIILWDNIGRSAMAFFGFYVVYCVGCVFNTLTLLTLVHVFSFTIPKVYQIYHVQIDDGLDKAVTCAHQLFKQIHAKIPPQISQYLQKRKAE